MLLPAQAFHRSSLNPSSLSTSSTSTHSNLHLHLHLNLHLHLHPDLSHLRGDYIFHSLLVPNHTPGSIDRSMASYYLKAAASYLDRSNISSSYTNLTPSPTHPSPSNPQSIPSSSSTSSHSNHHHHHPTSNNSNWSPPVRIGCWNVHRATHNTTNKLVSVWTADKRLDSSPSSSLTSLPGLVNAANSWASGASTNTSHHHPNQPKTPLEKVIEILKKEVSSLSRLRHPCILEVVEPLEETRTSMIFVTEPITGCLRDGIGQTDRRSSNVYPNRNPSQLNLELDEVETQKGLLQIGKGLQFLHESAKLVHGNLTPEAIIINAKGDWKISGFGLSTYLKQPDGLDSKWIFPDYDHRLPDCVQMDLDYLAPEYCLDENLSTSNDMYSLGCILHNLHTRSGPPFQNHHSLDQFRKNVENFGVLRAAWSRIPDDVQEVLSQLVTRTPSTRLGASSFLNSRYFSSNLLVSTLAFLDRDTFNSKQNEEHVQFLKGLLRILPQFSPKVLKQKILPSLIEECRKHVLLPFLLPNIFFIAQQMESEEFRSELLPHLTPLFAIKDPPQNVLILLDSLSILQSKSTPQVFREDVMPLIYFALESDLPSLQEKSLKVIPGLCESLEYTHVKQVLFPKVTMVFSKTTLLSVKVNTLICFHSMVKILDKFTLTEKLVPLLARIKTKEPAVMIATLAVHEEMGRKVELNAIATLILPQLWSMSIGPLLNIDQFNRFMNSIDQLSNRVKEEHTRHLIEAKRLEEATRNNHPSNPMNHTADSNNPLHEAANFENLVKGGAKSWSSIHSSQTFQQSLTAPTSPSINNAWGFGGDPIEDLISSASLSASASKSDPRPRPSSVVIQPTPRDHLTSTVSTSSNEFLNPSLATQARSSSYSSSRPASELKFDSILPNTQTRPQSISNDSLSTSHPPQSQFVGLPALVPQPSSLNQLVSSSSSSSQPASILTSNHRNSSSQAPLPQVNWNVIPTRSNPTHQKNTQHSVNLADFDPFA